jgi:hypothetical protein
MVASSGGIWYNIGTFNEDKQAVQQLSSANFFFLWQHVHPVLPLVVLRLSSSSIPPTTKLLNAIRYNKGPASGFPLPPTFNRYTDIRFLFCYTSNSSNLSPIFGRPVWRTATIYESIGLLLPEGRGLHPISVMLFYSNVCVRV